MELVYMRGSPWSAYLLWTLYLNNVEKEDIFAVKKIVEHHPMAGELYLRYKTGTLFKREESPSTVPILLGKNGELLESDSFDIAKRLCNPTMFPRDKEDSIRQWLAKANKVMRYQRGIFMNSGDSIVKAQIGNIPIVTSSLEAVINSFFKSKYGKRDLSIDADEVKEIILEAAKAVSMSKTNAANRRTIYMDAGDEGEDRLTYILGGEYPSIVDCKIAIMAEFLQPKYDCCIASIAPNMCDATAKKFVEPNKKALEPLFRWKEQMFEKHFLGKEDYPLRQALNVR